jgi:hypothetical protein
LTLRTAFRSLGQTPRPRRCLMKIELFVSAGRATFLF